MFPIGAPAQILVFAEGQPLTAIAIPPMGVAGSPVRGLEPGYALDHRNSLHLVRRRHNQKYQCDTGQYDFQPLTDGALFYARQGSVWFLVRVQINTTQSFTSPQFTSDE